MTLNRVILKKNQSFLLQPLVDCNFSEIKSTFLGSCWDYLTNFWWLCYMVSVCLTGICVWIFLLTQILAKTMSWKIYWLYTNHFLSIKDATLKSSINQEINHPIQIALVPLIPMNLLNINKVFAVSNCLEIAFS